MMRRPICVATAIASIAAATVVVAGCAGGAGEKADNASTDVRGTALTVFAPQAADQDLATNSGTAAVKSALGIDIRWETTTYDPGLADQERLESLAGGALPDVYLLISWVTMFPPEELRQHGSEGKIVPLNDLIDTYAPNVKKAFADTPAWKKLATAPDGKIYGLPQWNDCFHCSYPHKLWMNSTWLKTLGLPQPKTTEDLRRVLRAFKTKDPNGNGKADEIPLTGLSNTDEGSLIPYLMNAFVYDPAPARPDQVPLVLNHGKVQFQPAQDSYRKGLEYIASLYAEGLIDKAAFTQSYTALKARGDAAGGVLVGAAATQHPGNIVTLGHADGRDRQYDAVPPLTGPEGASYATYARQAVPGGIFVVTSEATKAEQIAAVKLLDYLVGTQGHLRMEFGEEGRSWMKPTTGEQALDTSLPPLFKHVRERPHETPRNDAWAAIAQIYSPASFRNAQVQPMGIYTVDGFERRLFQATRLYQGREPEDQICPTGSIWPDRAEASEIIALQADLQDFVARSELAFVTGQKRLDAVSWSAYLDGLRGLGLQRYLDLMQKAYDAVK